MKSDKRVAGGSDSETEATLFIYWRQLTPASLLTPDHLHTSLPLSAVARSPLPGFRKHTFTTTLAYAGFPLYHAQTTL